MRMRTPFQGSTPLAGIGLALILGLAAGGGALAQSRATTVLVVDATASMGSTIAGLGAVTTGLDQTLVKAGIQSSYGLTSFGSQFDASSGALAPDNRASRFNGQIFGSAANVADALSALTTARGRTDPYQALEYAMDAAGYLTPYRPDTRRNLYLVTDSVRETRFTQTDAAGLKTLLGQNHAALTVLVQSHLVGADGSPLAAVTRDPSGNLIGFKAGAGCAQTAFGKIVAPTQPSSAPLSPLSPADSAAIESDFINVALATGGVVADIEQVANAAVLSCALAQATLVGYKANAVAVQEAAIGQADHEALGRQVRALSRTLTERVAQVAERVREYRHRAALNGDPGAGTASPRGSAGLWSSVSASWTNTNPVGGVFKDASRTVMVGVDALAFDDAILGLAVGVETSDFDLVSAQGALTRTGVSITPYVAMMVNELVTVDAQVSAARAEDRVREAASGIGSSGRATTWRYYAAANLTAAKSLDRLTLRGGVGYAGGWSMPGSYRDTWSSLVRPDKARVHLVKLSGEASYLVGETFEPFLGFELSHDVATADKPEILPGSLTAGPKVGRTGLETTVGMRYVIANRLLFTLQGSGEVLRAKERQYTVDGNLRVAF